MNGMRIIFKIFGNIVTFKALTGLDLFVFQQGVFVNLLPKKKKKLGELLNTELKMYDTRWWSFQFLYCTGNIFKSDLRLFFFSDCYMTLIIFLTSAFILYHFCFTFTIYFAIIHFVLL